MGTSLKAKQDYEARKNARAREAKNKEPMPWWRLGQRDPVAQFTGWLVIVTMVLSVATIASVVALLVTDHTLKDTAKRQLRAYVYVDRATVILEGRRLKGVVDLKNTGQTPAYGLVAVSQLDTDEAGKPFTARPFTDVERSSGIVGPGGIFSPTSYLDIPLDNDFAIQAFKEGRGVIYLTGRAEYKDAFDRVWALDFRLRSHSFEGNHWILTPLPEGNEETQRK